MGPWSSDLHHQMIRGAILMGTLIGIISSKLKVDCEWVGGASRTPTLTATPLMKNAAHTQTGTDPVPPYLQTVQADETGYSKSINDILLLRAGLPSFPPGGTRSSGGGRWVRRFFTGQGGGVPPRTVSLPVGAGGVGVGAAGVSAPCLPQPPHPLPLGPASATLLQFPIHGVRESLQCQKEI